MSLSVVLNNSPVSNDKKRLPIRCQNMYARCGAPPLRREPYTTSATPCSIGAINAITSAGSYSMSASWMTAMSFATRVAASRTADPLPRLGWRSSSTCGRPAA